ncbi:MAG: NUDIX domain-containing protein [Verrucomicrobia bacterium]|nr:NUDIX domain-containing protein [Verrucomicrobiota bacterium]
MTEPSALFRHCPRCGEPRSAGLQANPLVCRACGLVYYLNPTVSVGVILRDAAGRVLLICRGKPPGRGKLALPGGFIDFDETVEQALRREVREEVGLAVRRLRFLCSEVNQYAYCGVTYPVVDLFFVAAVSRSERAVAASAEVAGFRWYAPGEIPLGAVAFPSVRRALERYACDGRLRCRGR